MPIHPAGIALYSLPSLGEPRFYRPFAVPAALTLRGPARSEHDFDAAALSRVRQLIDEIRRLVDAPVVVNRDLTAQSTAVAWATQTISRLVARNRTIVSTDIAGLNAAQIAGVSVSGLSAGEQFVIAGEVTSAVSPARLTVVGGAGTTLTAGGTYALSGSRGSVELALVKGESLDDVARRINQDAAATGVVAAVVGNDLALTSIDFGRGASIRLEPRDVEDIPSVSGLNAAHLERFDVAALAPGSSETIGGSLLSAAERATLTYQGSTGGIVAGTASFLLSGMRGAATIGVTRGESLADVAARINALTATTGVVAELDGNNLRLASDSTGAAARVEVSSLETAFDQEVSGLNPAQVDVLEVISLAEGSEHVLSGHVLRSASSAELALQGSAGGTVIDSATFELSGLLGTATIAIERGESLAAVAQRVNAISDATGVVAQAAGDRLLFHSTELGSAARAEIDLVHVEHTTTVSGVNPSQLSSFQVDQFTDGASHTVSGSITQTATRAELSFKGGPFSTVGRTATFTLSGSQGSAQFSTTALQSLASLASAVNQQTATTGVTATVQGNQIKFRSVGVGSAATVGIQVTSGTFPVTGGNGTANGANAVAVIKGQTLTGAGNDFSFSDALGSYSFAAAAGFTGAFATVSIESEAGEFDVTGGDGNGSATGLDALAEINGVALTGTANRFVVGESGGQFALEFAANFTGGFDPITLRSAPHPFEISGGDGAGHDLGADAVAEFNGLQQASPDGRFTVVGEHGTYEVEFAPGFNGAFDPVTVTSSFEVLQTIGGDASGAAYGQSGEAIVNGRLLVTSGREFHLLDGGRRVALGFQPGFTGVFDPIIASGRAHSVSETIPLFETVFVPSPAYGSAPQPPVSGRQVAQQTLFSHLLDELDGLLRAAHDSYSAAERRGPQMPMLFAIPSAERHFGQFYFVQPGATVDLWG